MVHWGWGGTKEEVGGLKQKVSSDQGSLSGRGMKQRAPAGTSVAKEREEKQTQNLVFMTGSLFLLLYRSEAEKLKYCHCAKLLKEYKQTKFRDLLFLRSAELWDKYKWAPTAE